MSIKKLSKLASNPKFISGIYNYCDRWCERCILTARCLVFEGMKMDINNPELNDITNKAFWNHLHSIFQETIEMLNEWAKKEGIDLDSLKLDSASDEKYYKRSENELAKLALEYSKIVSDWFKLNKPQFDEKISNFRVLHNIGVDENDIYNEAFDFHGAIEVIGWYQNQIYVKLMRALDREILNNESNDTLQKDSDGSAKIALIAIDRSIASWGKLCEYFSEETDKILDILLLLSRLRKKTEETFPNARNFIRPGFDILETINLS